MCLADDLLSRLPQGAALIVSPMGGTSFRFVALEAGDLTAFDLDAVAPVLAPPLLKAGDAIPPGARWVTVHPNGPGSKGVPVLVQEEKKGSGVWHVIGGAGGNLNYLKLRGVKSPEHYRQEAAERAKERRAEKKAQLDADKAAGLTGDKLKENENIGAQVRETERNFIETVAKLQGWGEEEVAPPSVDGLTEKAADKALKDHHRALLAKAKAAVDLQRTALMSDAELRAAALSGGVPVVGATDDQVSVADLAPAKPQVPKGVSAAFSERAAAAGLAPGEAKVEAAAVAGVDLEERAAKAVTRAEVAKAIKQELQGLAPAPAAQLRPKVAEASKAVQILVAQKKLAAARRAAAAARAEVAAATVVEPKAYVLAVAEPAAEQLEKAVADELATATTRSFLAASKHASMQHVADGAANALGSVSLALAGTSALDRSAIDVLGAGAAAQVLARRLRLDLTPEEFEQAAGAVEDAHRETHVQRAQEVLGQVEALHKLAGQALPDVVGADEVASAASAVQARAQALADAERLLGQTLGGFEAHAALVAAMKAPPAEFVDVSLGGVALETAVTQARALGLQKGEYELTRDGGNVFLRVHAAGMDRLASPVLRDDLRRVSRNVAIARGDLDEDDWMPQGFARRPDLALNLKPGAAPSLAVPFTPGPDLAASLREYIGSRTADGDSPADILSDVQSAPFWDKAGASRVKEYRAALDAVAPNKLADGKKLQRAEQLAPMFEAYADEFCAARGLERLPLHRQSFDADDVAQEALHRALSAHPEGVAAYKAVGELTPQDQAAVRDWFARHIAKESPEAAGLRKQKAEHLAAEPAKVETDMFGEEAVTPEWRAWSAQRDELAEKVRAAGFGWADYVKTMRSPTRAYAAAQDLIRSRVSESFHAAYNTLRPGSLALGRSVIRDNLRHLDAVDPEARAARLAKEKALIDSMRNRTGGKYAAGSVADKLDAAKEQQAAFEQAQMGFFGDDGADDGFGKKAPAPLGADERHTLGHAAEAKLASMVATVGRNFEPGKPVKLFHATMSGPSGAVRQRAIKHVVENGRSVLGLGVGTGKAQPLDAKVLTPSGWRRMGDLAVGDEVIAGDGSVALVTGVFPQGDKEIFRVVMADGGSTECCAEHLWRTTTEVERKRAAYLLAGRKRTAARRDLPLSGVRSTAEIAASLVVRHGIRNHHVPVAGEVQFPSRAVDVDPYLLGLLLGDGGITSNKLIFSTVDAEILAAVERLLPAGIAPRPDGDGCTYRLTSGRRGGEARAVNPLYAALYGLGLIGCGSADKFVPGDYLVNDAATRLAVLQGLMDTDGTVCSRSGQASFVSTSSALVDAVAFIVRSLGGIARIGSWVRKTFTHNGERREGLPSCCVFVSLPAGVKPFRLSRKLALYRPPTKYAPRSRVIALVESVGMKPAQCISISHPSRLYVTDDFIVTHNTAIGLGAFAHLHGMGRVKKGVFVVPSIVQGQFGAEALRFMEPGKFAWHCQPGASFEERLAAYKDPGTHFVVATHQSFRDDLLKIASMQGHGKPVEVADKMAGMDAAGRKKFLAGVLKKAGIPIDYVMADEAHGLLDREGKADSRLSQIVQGVTDSVPYYVHASGDPVKNDASEAHSLLAKMDPARYADRAAFMRRYGGDTQAAREGLRRELARHVYAAELKPDVQVTRTVQRVPLAAVQKEALAKMERAHGRLKVARAQGKVDVAAAREFAPQAFDGVPEDQHAAVAAHVTKSAALMREAASRAILDEHPQSAKLDAAVAHAAARKGKPGVVFARSLKAVETLRQRLEAAGHRVVTITGADSSESKAEKIRAFNPESGERKADIVLCSDAGAVGANLQSGSWLLQYDVPDTAMAQPLDAKVLTPSGWRRMGDLAVGDKVLTPDGSEAAVLGVYPQGVKDIYRLTFSDGSSTECTADHLWLTRSRTRKDQMGWAVESLQDMLPTLSQKDGAAGFRPTRQIPLVGRIDVADQDLPLDPYLLGVLLGDGEFGKKHVGLACADADILSRVTDAVERMGGRVSRVTSDSRGFSYRLIGDGALEPVFPRRAISPVLERARRLGFGNRVKFVPDQYLVASFDQRLALLQGLMDTDGTADSRTGSASFCNTNERLIEAVMQLTWSLGGVARRSRPMQSVHCGKPGLLHWKVTVTLPPGVCPFHLRRKAERFEQRQSWVKMTRHLVGVELVRAAEAQCILIDHHDHLYVTDDWIVTHNTHAQRQGRINRTGQKNAVELTDLVADHAREDRARARLERKYGLRQLVTSPLETLDDSGVAYYLRAREQAQSQAGLF